MRRPRLTIGRLMALVAVLGLALGATSWGLSSTCHYRAERCESVAHELRGYIKVLERRKPSSLTSDELLSLRQKLARFEQMARRYRAAQRRPWLAMPEGSE